MTDRIAMFIAKQISTLKYIYESQLKELEDYARHYFPDADEADIKAGVDKAVKAIFGERVTQ